jgi:hypothetical protein
VRKGVLLEALAVIWIVASPLAISSWVEGFEDPVGWAAFIAGVLGVLVGWLAIPAAGPESA